jgi:hypothetical protein
LINKAELACFSVILLLMIDALEVKSSKVRASLWGGPAGQLPGEPGYKGHLKDVRGIIGNMVLVNSGLHERKEFENYP